MVYTTTTSLFLPPIKIWGVHICLAYILSSGAEIRTGVGPVEFGFLCMALNQDTAGPPTVSSFDSDILPYVSNCLHLPYPVNTESHWVTTEEACVKSGKNENHTPFKEDLETYFPKMHLLHTALEFSPFLQSQCIASPVWEEKNNLFTVTFTFLPPEVGICIFLFFMQTHRHMLFPSSSHGPGVWREVVSNASTVEGFLKLVLLDLLT